MKLTGCEGRLNNTDYDPETQIASLLPGARWLEVYKTFDKLDRGIQGGGIGAVGVGGLLLGGGFSNYLYQRGFATDDVVNFESFLPMAASSKPTQQQIKTYGGH